MVDFSTYMNMQVDAESLLLQTISGDVYQCSLFALGISPYMISSIIVQVISSFRNAESRKKSSPTGMNRFTLALTLLLAVLLAVVQAQELQFRVEGEALMLAKVIAVVEMVAGAMMILYLSSRNKKYGIGGQSALIFVNVIDGINVMLQGYDIQQLAVPLIISFVVIVIMVVMENAEKRIPVQRISIHNIYADKNYLAIKLNPIGVMPAMFSMAFFMLAQLLVSVICWFMPENGYVSWWQDNMELSEPLGIAVYILILYCLTIGFSRVFVNPGEITEQFLKSGDSLQDLHAGKDTKKYLSQSITKISLLSAMVMSICLGVPMILQLTGGFESSLVSLPSSIMMLTGLWCNLYREVMAIRDLEAYKPFI
ncbi:MAG: preprotein translocase subunit SecY [Lachnospiraceae bacterium]|nr:preprotein translocase subunit SecY [Lachnospiraceae bacterium]